MLPLAEEADRLRVWSATLARSHFASHKLWMRSNAVTNGGAAVLAAATGITALGDWIGTFGVGVASLATAVLASIGSLTKASDRAASARDSGNAYAALRDELRQFVLIDAKALDYDTGRAKLAELSKRYHAANNVSEPPLSIPFARFVRRGRAAAGEMR